MTTIQTETVNRAEALFTKLSEWRRKLHMNPELSFQEFNTAQFVSETLRKIDGMEVKTGLEETGLLTGVIGTLSSGEGPTIAFRGDMDALPILEETNQEYSSRNQGVMHACGHDAHTTILLGAAHVIADMMKHDQLKGTVKFIFQPAEESTDEHGLTGAPHMIQAGALEGVDCVLALHMSPENPVGEIKVHDGHSMASVDVFESRIFGTGGHAAYPHLGTDPIWMLGPVLQAIHGIVSRRITPLEPGVVSVTQIHSGTTSNVIPTEVFIQGTLRSYNPEVRELLISELEKALSVARALGGNYSNHVSRGEPALKNHPVVNQWLSQTINDLYPECEIIPEPFGLGGEDFGYMTQVAPGAMFFLGCALSDGIERDLHTPIFDIDERCLPMGVAIMSEMAARYLKGEIGFQNKN
jgi:amidohydrolase